MDNIFYHNHKLYKLNHHLNISQLNYQHSEKMDNILHDKYHFLQIYFLIYLKYL